MLFNSYPVYSHLSVPNSWHYSSLFFDIIPSLDFWHTHILVFLLLPLLFIFSLLSWVLFFFLISNIGEFQGPALCSLLYLYSFFHDLIQYDSFKYQLDAKDPQINITNLVFPKLQMCIFSCLLDISTQMATRHLKISMSQTELCIFSPFPKHVLFDFLPLRWWQIHPLSI